jgi:hypothetical protein
MKRDDIDIPIYLPSIHPISLTTSSPYAKEQNTTTRMNKSGHGHGCV